MATVEDRTVRRNTCMCSQGEASYERAKQWKRHVSKEDWLNKPWQPTPWSFMCLLTREGTFDGY